jgi:hypothetical protein
MELTRHSAGEGVWIRGEGVAAQVEGARSEQEDSRWLRLLSLISAIEMLALRKPLHLPRRKRRER